MADTPNIGMLPLIMLARALKLDNHYTKAYVKVHVYSSKAEGEACIKSASLAYSSGSSQRMPSIGRPEVWVRR